MNRSILGFAAAAVGLAGCVPLGSPGSLQDGAFAYVCPSAGGSMTDASCGSSLFGSGDIPAAIAVGAHFDLQFNRTLDIGSDPPPVNGLVPVATSILVTEGSLEAGATGFRFAKPGVVAVLARTTGDTVADFLHATGVALDHVALQDSLGKPLTSLAVPSTGASLQAVPQGAADQPLAGAMTYTWTSSDESVVTVQALKSLGGEVPSNSVELVPGNPGKATITVTIQSVPASIDVTVGGTP